MDLSKFYLIFMTKIENKKDKRFVDDVVHDNDEQKNIKREQEPIWTSLLHNNRYIYIYDANVYISIFVFTIPPMFMVT